MNSGIGCTGADSPFTVREHSQLGHRSQGRFSCSTSSTATGMHKPSLLYVLDALLTNSMPWNISSDAQGCDTGTCLSRRRTCGLCPHEPIDFFWLLIESKRHLSRYGVERAGQSHAGHAVNLEDEPARMKAGHQPARHSSSATVDRQESPVNQNPIKMASTMASLVRTCLWRPGSA